MPIIPTSSDVTIASFMKVLGTGSCGTVWLVADEADTVQDLAAALAHDEALTTQSSSPGDARAAPRLPPHLRRERSGGSAPQMRRGPTAGRRPGLCPCGHLLPQFCRFGKASPCRW